MKVCPLTMVEASWIQAPALGGALGIYLETFGKPSRHRSSTYCQACETIHEDPSSITPLSPLLYEIWMEEVRIIDESNSVRAQHR
jgi:hypothetical protein